MEVSLNVKDKSVLTFLTERLIDLESSLDREERFARMQRTGAHNLLKDEMYFKKDCGIEVGEVVKIELFDRSQLTGTPLVNIYTYEAEFYDDVCIKMTLQDFKVDSRVEPKQA